MRTIAQTGEQFADFSPYVPAINNNGIVAFQAALRAGGTGVFIGDGRTSECQCVVDSNAVEGLSEIYSHPDLNDAGVMCFYGRVSGDETSLFIVRNGAVERIADSCGPLGPTMNQQGHVAFRTSGCGDAQAMLLWDGARSTPVAETGDVFRAFHGLPVVNDEGAVAFRADLAAGGEGIYLWREGKTIPIARSDDALREFGRFPSLNGEGQVAFCATHHDDTQGVYVACERAMSLVVHSSSGFEHFRGALNDAAGRVIYYATPVNGSLGVFTGTGEAVERLLGIGLPMDGSTATEFALNPVSINDAGQLAIRVQLENGRQIILRADPTD